MTIEDLVERVRGLTGPDREVDRAIGRQFGVTETTFPQYEPGDVMPRYTASIDAALALAERVLPGSMKRVFDNPDDGSVRAEIIHGIIYGKGDHDTWPLAIVLATLIATQSSETK